ncbi:DgyrCDS8871 [Dimorphilus gyrociliatus]|uniref:DgyrCDS8871 n=1 Tax=Dimorphilus gyrociliatus TaxID=2664684 RepID=A0A7I8VWK7_9ANNE|nr:DgyrCDS8871 [Dimorphilus gyrociliatus]
MTSQDVTGKKKADLKVVILGAANVGKTTLIHRYAKGVFSEHPNTLGASFTLKQWKNRNVAIWDTAGEERFQGLSNFYCRQAGAAILAYDVTERKSFEELKTRFTQLLAAAEPNRLAVVVGTKHDLVEEKGKAVEREEAVLLAKQLNPNISDYIPIFETSSLNGLGVTEVFETIFEKCLRFDAIATHLVNSTIDLSAQKKAGSNNSKNNCAC